MFMGPAVLRGVIESADLYPIKGLFNFKNYLGEIDAYYHQTLGTEIGISTGWKAMDDLYNVCIYHIIVCLVRCYRLVTICVMLHVPRLFQES